MLCSAPLLRRGALLIRGPHLLHLQMGPGSAEQRQEPLHRVRDAHALKRQIHFIRNSSMTLPSTFAIDAPGDAARAAELRRVKALATLVLAGTLALFVT